MSHCVSWTTGLTPSLEKWVGLDGKMRQEPRSSARVQARRLAWLLRALGLQRGGDTWAKVDRTLRDHRKAPSLTVMTDSCLASSFSDLSLMF